jgi:hypothetical protein
MSNLPVSLGLGCFSPCVNTWDRPLHGIDPFGYLRDVLARLPRSTNHQVPSLTPAAWQTTQQAALLEAAS